MIRLEPATKGKREASGEAETPVTGKNVNIPSSNRPGGSMGSKNLLAAVFVAVSTVAMPSSLSAVGPTTRVTIEGPDLPSPIEIVDRAKLAGMNVWTGPGASRLGPLETTGFIIDWGAGPVTQRPDGLPRYKVSFYVQNRTAPPGAEALAYIVYYEFDRASNRGFIYLPGKDDPEWEFNTLSIYRRLEGNWFRPDQEWEETVNSLLSR
jgi:hypothetical protein